MPKIRAILQLEDDEKEVLKAVHDRRELLSVAKPMLDGIGDQSEKISNIGKADGVEMDAVRGALEGYATYRDFIERMPDSDKRDDLLERLDRAKTILDELEQLSLND